MAPPANRSPRHGGSGFFVSTRMASFLVLCMLVMLSLQLETLWSPSFRRQTPIVNIPSSPSLNHLRVHHSAPGQDQCRLYLAESAIPYGGLGVFTGVGLHPGDLLGFPDICLYVADMQSDVSEWMQLRTHTWGRASFFGQFEGHSSRAACEGIVTTFNTMPDHMINAKIVSAALPTNAGLHRAYDEGAGAVTHHYGVHAVATDTTTAGSELVIYYGDWTFDPNKQYTKPERSVEDLRENGWCIDNIEIRPANDPSMGRGAFTTRAFAMGAVVAPAPLQSFPDRKAFSDAAGREQLIVNYCLQPKHSKMLFFPYGQGVGLINHSTRPNVALQWSKNPLHHADWVNMSLDDYWTVSKPGGIILEVVALRPIAAGEELFMDYGSDWQAAWDKHVAAWSPVGGAGSYVYPAEMDETAVLRTVQEQETDPYPDNLITVCQTPDWSSRGEDRTTEWYDSGWFWWQGMTYCHILDREMGDDGKPYYSVSLVFHSFGKYLDYNPQTPRSQMYIDTKVPRRAIRFVERPYMDDEHLLQAFRHPIEFPEELVPDAWKTDL